MRVRHAFSNGDSKADRTKHSVSKSSARSMQESFACSNAWSIAEWALCSVFKADLNACSTCVLECRFKGGSNNAFGFEIECAFNARIVCVFNRVVDCGMGFVFRFSMRI